MLWRRLYFSVYFSSPLLNREWKLVQLFIVLHAERWTVWGYIHGDSWIYCLYQHQKSLIAFEKELNNFMKD